MVTFNKTQKDVVGFNNYFVNNAFELRNPPEFKRPVYGWHVNGGKYEVTLFDCHDDIHDITAMYHGKQGQSLAITLKPGEKTVVSNAVKIVLDSGSRVVVSGWFKHLVPEAEITFDVDGKKVTVPMPVAARGLKENTLWQEITFSPVVFPQGKKVSAVVSFTVKNAGKTEVKCFMDDLRFRMAR